VRGAAGDGAEADLGRLPDRALQALVLPDEVERPPTAVCLDGMSGYRVRCMRQNGWAGVMVGVRARSLPGLLRPVDSLTAEGVERDPPQPLDKEDRREVVEVATMSFSAATSTLNGPTSWAPRPAERQRERQPPVRQLLEWFPASFPRPPVKGKVRPSEAAWPLPSTEAAAPTKPSSGTSVGRGCTSAGGPDGITRDRPGTRGPQPAASRGSQAKGGLPGQPCGSQRCAPSGPDTHPSAARAPRAASQ
jgi:hypothetical protein